ncbi:MAG: hypothetical protein EU532_01900 [Promethearchaeota archaeon]|nr:MAG: hypothetical protein EU532_01900 [Candidatus Lokiarchaeota archaeon]
MLNSKDKVYQWGIELSKFSPRIPGTMNIDNARDFILQKLKSFGLKTWIEPINFRGVFHQEWEFRIVSPENRKLISCPQNNVGFGNIDAEIIDIGKGKIKDYQNQDVTGKIVLINWGKLTDHEGPCGLKKRYPLLASYDLAWKRGAAGMVGYFIDTPGNSLKILEPGINPTGGSNIPGPAEIGEERQFMLPVLHIGKKDARILKNIISKSKVTAHLHIRGKRKVSTVYTVVGVLPGLKKNAVVVGAHYCSTFEGAICDTVGVVGALELARKFSMMPLKKRSKTMLFLFSGSHVWINCNISSLCFIERHKKYISNLVAMLWMDHISAPVFINGERISRWKFPLRLGLTSDNFILYLITYYSMLKNRRLPFVLPLNRIWTLCEMGPFDNIGIPCMCMQVASDLMLTTEDTWDKIDAHQLNKDISVYVDLAKLIQLIPARILKLFEFPGRSFFGCGALFKDTSQPKYDNKHCYEPENAPPLLIGGYKKALKFKSDFSNVINNK